MRGSRSTQSTCSFLSVTTFETAANEVFPSLVDIPTRFGAILRRARVRALERRVVLSSSVNYKFANISGRSTPFRRIPAGSAREKMKHLSKEQGTLVRKSTHSFSSNFSVVLLPKCASSPERVSITAFDSLLKHSRALVHQSTEIMEVLGICKIAMRQLF